MSKKIQFARQVTIITKLINWPPAFLAATRALKNIPLMLAIEDTKQAYRRSKIGTFWLSLSMAVQIATIGAVFGLIFKSQLATYLPFLSTSLVVWSFIAGTISDGCQTFIAAEPMIKQLNLNHSQYVLRVIYRNIFNAAHNFILLPFVFLIFPQSVSCSILAVVPGLLILIINLTWVAWILGIASARFRDLPPIINSLMTVAFYVTPVMWYPKLIENNDLAHLLLGFNPFYHWLQIVRLPIMGQWPTWENWGLALLSAGIGWTITLFAYKKYRNMIAYWV